ncbi:hypothetical protein AQUCO_00400473v1 [Aquilegia coerulea]|uniref:Small ribosomal subunit protein mS29 n=1 Tax=Aquilegia coerulea TaxID=218851 RepID=A0A2G5EV47_AQUCA|nr:hypothetical protein AQUCO_00400473v1 [Aquilegia coerulea]
MLRSLLKTAISSSKLNSTSTLLIPTTTNLLSSSHFSSKASKSSSSSSGGAKGSKNKIKQKTKPSSTTAASQTEDLPTLDEDIDLSLDDESRVRNLSEEINDKSLDVGLNGRPLFTRTKTISQLTRKDTCFYMEFSLDELNEVLPEGLPEGMTKEFDEAKRNGLLVRQNFLELRDNFRRIVDPTLCSANGKVPKVRKQIVLDGPASGGKSIALAMLVKWAREQGWLVLYVPKGKEWTHGGYFYHNPQTELWDTPVQAGGGLGWMRGGDSMTMAERFQLFHLVQAGISPPPAAGGVVIPLREKIYLGKNIPVLFCIAHWFTFSEYGEPVTVRSSRPIHSKELATVRAFRSMMHDNMMVGAFSHSTAVGKLRKDLPDVPVDARVDFPRYSLNEAASVCYYYVRQRLIRREVFSDEKWKKIYYLSNGNGAEMRWLAPFIR